MLTQKLADFFQKKIKNKKYILFYLSSAPLHLNYVKELIKFLISDNSLQLFVYSTFSLPSYMKGNVIHIQDPYQIRGIPLDILITVDTGRPIDYHPSTKIIHLPHSLSSTHVIYPDGSFDWFDFIFCAGPHHTHELLQMLPKRGVHSYLVPLGYGVVDGMLMNPQVETMPKTILFAPSWGPNNALKKFGIEIISFLISDYKVILRPHIMSLKEDSDIITKINKKFLDNQNYTFDESPDSSTSLSKASLIISDYSGVAFEYALAYFRPVLFIDSPPKVFNENWGDYCDSMGIEYEKRNDFGLVLKNLNEINKKINFLFENFDDFHNQIKRIHTDYIYNRGKFVENADFSLKKILNNEYDPKWVLT